MRLQSNKESKGSTSMLLFSSNNKSISCLRVSYTLYFSGLQNFSQGVSYNICENQPLVMPFLGFPSNKTTVEAKTK